MRHATDPVTPTFFEIQSDQVKKNMPHKSNFVIVLKIRLNMQGTYVVT